MKNMTYQQIEERLTALWEDYETNQHNTLGYNPFPVLKECVELCQRLPCDTADQKLDKVAILLFVADEYYMAGHYPWAIEQYKELLKLVDKDSEDGQDKFKEACHALIRIYERLGKFSESKQIGQELVAAGLKMPTRDRFCLNRDCVEVTQEYFDCLEQLHQRLEQRLQGQIRRHGSCYEYWSVKGELLLQEFGITWKSPAQMNPTTHFD